jgi:hypothetical protein
MSSDIRLDLVNSLHNAIRAGDIDGFSWQHLRELAENLKRIKKGPPLTDVDRTTRVVAERAGRV